jgi:hypothetical protein
MNAISHLVDADYMNKCRAWLASNPDATVEDWYRRFSRVVTFDSSAHNRIVKIGPAADPIYSAIGAKFFFRLAGLSYEELASTLPASERMALLEGCRKLTATPVAERWDCVHTFYEMLRVLIKEHSIDPASFRWLSIDVRSGDLAHEILTGEITGDDGLARMQRTEQLASLKAYKATWLKLRPKLDPIFEAQGIPRPMTFADAYQNGSPALFPAMGKALYDAGLRFDAELSGESRTFDTPPETVKHFIDNCPPFRAVLLALLLSWYNTSLRVGNKSEKLAAGRNDLFMAVYLPLCDIFVTRDSGQEKCLRELRKYLGSPAAEIMSFDEFAGLCA